jgi:Zn ribbon nucleic-acid-binding protein
MNSPVECPKCGHAMAEGFVLDVSHGAQLVSRWIAGQPEPSFWVGTKIGGKDQHKIQTFRCIGCGYLESYAREN